MWVPEMPARGAVPTPQTPLSRAAATPPAEVP